MKLSNFKTAAINNFNKWSNHYDDTLAAYNAAILDSAKTKTTLPNNYWQPLHRAFIRKEAARQFLEIILEIEKEK